MKKISWLKYKIHIFSIILILFFFNSCQFRYKEKIFSKTDILMDTYFEVKFYYKDKNAAYYILNKVFNEISRIENKFSVFNSSSIIYEINQKKNLFIDEETYNLISNSIYISSITNGAFDITILPLALQWKINLQESNLPSKKNIEQTKNFVDYKKIILKKYIKSDETKYQIILSSPLKGIDLGGIAKGYTIKSIKNILDKHKIKNYLINAGGEVYCNGDKVWKIGIQHPRKPFGEIYTILKLQNMTISTSGDYERYFIKDNVRYHHIIDPKTGFPANRSISVSIICKDPILADGLSTAIFVIGNDLNQINEIQKKTDTFDYILIDKNLQIHKSKKFINLDTHL